MTDITKYKNISIDKKCYETITNLQTKVAPVEISRSQVVRLAIKNLYEQVSFKKLQQPRG